jgi:MoxR-like ATPase
VKTAAETIMTAIVPDMSEYDSYVSREIFGVKDIDLLRYAKDARKNVILMGDTGAGKSHLIRAYCAVERMPLVIIPCNGGIETATLYGMPVQDAAGRITFQESGLVKVIREGGFIFLDEINFMPNKVAAGMHQVLRERILVILEKMGETIHLNPDAQFGAAMNEEYRGTHPLNEAFKNRFALKLPFPYSREVEEQLVCMPIMLDVAARLRASYKNGDLETPVSTNMLTEFEEFCVDINYDFAVHNFLAAFATHERSAVEEVIGLFKDTITEQLNEMMADE